jgi:hypothetical protein
MPRRAAPPFGVSTAELDTEPAVEDIGAWVVGELQRHGLNLRATERSLQARRQRGASRRTVPVFDRGALDYYWCGEFLHRLVSRDFAFDAVVAELAGKPRLVARMRRKARVFLRVCATRDAAAARTRRRLPEAYHPAFEAVVEAVQSRRWRPPV